MNMKFLEILLSEGRREKLFNEYSDAFTLEQLDYLLNDEFIKNTNYKYADFILDRLVKFYNLTPGTTHIQDAIDDVKEFDRIGKNLEKKDINQYQSLGELSMELKDYTSKSQERKAESDAKKIYEDSRVLIVRPLSHKASCKYGAGTKWCTTEKSPGYFDKYTSKGQALYYIIMKEFDITNKFYKIALHKVQSGQETWYDAEDIVMPPREVDLLKTGLGKNAIKSIEENFHGDNKHIIEDIFNPKNKVLYGIENVFRTKKSFALEFLNPIHMGGKTGSVSINVIFNGEIIDKLNYVFTYNESFYVPSEKITSIVGTIEGEDDIEPEFDSLPIVINERIFVNIISSDNNPFHTLCKTLYEHLNPLFLKDISFRKSILKVPEHTWQPYHGFTFKRSPLMKKLVDYISKGNKGTRLDFLIKLGILKKTKMTDGTVYYSSKRGYVTPEGYLSSFFADAKRAGIINYEKRNNKNIIVKGPNFKNFKEGKLKAV